ncbi:MAG: hypothetical protein QM764_09755 [Chitinophagaceae bacterium]
MKMLQLKKQHSMYGVSLLLAPFFQFISGFFWVGKEYGVTGGTLLFLSVLFWIPALIVLFDLVKEKYPNYAAWGLLIAIIGFISGANFAMVGVMSEIFNIDHDSYLRGFSNYKLSADILLFQSGPLAPVSLLVLGVVLWRTRSVAPLIASLIIVGAILFPLSRILRVEWVTHVCDIFLLIPLSVLGINILNNR